MKKYLKVFDIGLQNTFVYRWNFWFRSLFAIFPLLGTVFIWGAIFEAKGGGINQYDYAAVVFYFLLVMALDGLISPTDDESQIATDIRDGQMNSFLIKPMNYLGYRLALFLSTRILYSLVTLPVMFGIFFAFRQYLRWPSEWETWAVSGISAVLAAALQFFISYSVAMLAFWMLEISTVVFIIFSFEYFLSGHMFPLGFMPPAIQVFLGFLPFPYELYFPISIFMGQIQGWAVWEGLAIQIVWVLIAFGGANLLWRRGLRQYQAVGG
jgi:ABC-2 type transport system permease protein